VQQDASIGITFTWLFALGVILVSAFAGQVDLDQECVLYGEIAYVPWDVWTTAAGGSMGPRAVWILGSMFAFNVAWITLCYKELKVCSFDPELAASMGIPVALFHYALMAATSMTTVTAFESVGAILVVALIVGPAATAYLLTHRLNRMLLIAVGIGFVAAVLGYALAAALDASIAGSMSVVIGALFTLALLFSPDQGIVPRAWRQRSLSREVAAGGAVPGPVPPRP
jgi:manganese/zinc/iron transport system permease protein